MIQLLVIYIKFSKKGMMQAFFQLQLGSLSFKMHSPQSEKKHWNKTPMNICRCIHAHNYAGCGLLMACGLLGWLTIISGQDLEVLHLKMIVMGMVRDVYCTTLLFREYSASTLM